MAAVSGVYDALVGVSMLLGRPLLAQLFEIPLPQPPIHAPMPSPNSWRTGVQRGRFHPRSRSGAITVTRYRFQHPYSSAGAASVLARIDPAGLVVWVASNARFSRAKTDDMAVW